MRTWIVLAAGFSFMSAALAEEKIARLFEIGKTDQAPVFVQKTLVTENEKGEKNWDSKMTDAQGNLVMTEKARINGLEIFHQYVEQLQIQESYELNYQDGKITFKTFKLSEGKDPKLVETQERRFSEPFIMGPLTELFLMANWERLSGGKALRVDFGIFELSKMISFQFQKIEETKDLLVVKMKPGNMFVSMLVDPMRIELDKATKRMVRYIGRTPVRTKVKGEWKPFDSEILYP